MLRGSFGAVSQGSAEVKSFIPEARKKGEEEGQEEGQEEGGQTVFYLYEMLALGNYGCPLLPGFCLSLFAPLVTAIAKAYAWQEELESGEYGSTEELAKAKKVDRSYAGRILKLTSLAPEIVERILAGETPESISLRKLRSGIDLIWSKQIEKYVSS